MSSAAVSATGVYLAFGDGDGNVHLMTSADEEGDLPFNGFEGQPVEWPDAPAPIPDINWTDSTYVPLFYALRALLITFKSTQ